VKKGKLNQKKAKGGVLSKTNTPGTWTKKEKEMNKNIFKVSLILLLAIGLTSTSFAQRQTGTIHGTVIDEEGTALPGATVTISGPAMQGSRTYVTSETGKFRFPALLPGYYEIKAELPGFTTVITKSILVSVGKTTEQTVTLRVATIEEEVTVIGESPVVDMETSKVSVHYGTDFLMSIPMSRDLYGIQNSIPGAISEGRDYRRTSSILGGTVRSALYQLDGVPMNDPTTWYSMANINVDVYEEIEFVIGAIPAEIGQTDSVAINIVTKSGGNKFTVGVTGYYTGKSLAGNMWSQEDLEAINIDAPRSYEEYLDGSIGFGGPLIQDKIWFYTNGRRLTYDRINPETHHIRLAPVAAADPGAISQYNTYPFTAAELQHYDIAHQEWMGFAKITFQLTDSISYMGMIHYNHLYEPVYSNRTGNDGSWANTAIWDHENTYATTHQFNWVLNQNTFLDIRGTYVYRHFPIMMRPEYANNYTTFCDEEDVWWGNTTYTDDYIRKKTLASASMTRFQDDFLGADHEIKVGAEFEDTVYFRDRCRGYEEGDNPYYTYWEDYPAADPYYYDTDDREGRLRIRPYPELGVWKAYDNTRRFAVYGQDSITAGRLAINLGLRLDYGYLYEPEQTRPQMDDRWKVGPEFLNPTLAATDHNILLKALNDQYHNDADIEFNQTSALDAIQTPYKRVMGFTTLSPRIGLVYDLFGDGKTALKLSFSRYFEPIWSGKYNAGQLFGGSMSWYWYDRNDNGWMDLPVPLGSPDNSYGKAPDQAQYLDPNGDEYRLTSYDVQDPKFNYYIPDLKAPYMHEFIAGIEHEIVKDFKLGLQFVYKVNKNIVEDVDKNNGYDPNAVDAEGRPIWIPYTATDPGWDEEFGTNDDQQITVYGLAEYAPTRAYHGVNPSDAKREYIAGILTFDKRMSNKWQLKGSILYSAFKGNHDPGYSATEGESGMFDNPNTMINSYGRVVFDHPLQIKIMGTYILPYDFILTAYLQHRSGSPWARSLDRVYFPSGFESQDSYASSINTELDGSRRNRPYTMLDLRLEKSFTYGEYGKLSFYLDAFNVGGRSGIQVNRNPNARLYDYRDPPEYRLGSTYGQITGAYGVRSVRFGVRFTF